MAISNFSKLIKDRIYRDFLNSLNKTIITESTNSFRSAEQTAPKTSFYITANTLRSMIKTIGNIDIEPKEAEDLLNQLLVPLKNSPTAQKITINNGTETAVFFANIGWGTITEKIRNILYQFPEVDAALSLAEDQYFKNEEIDIKEKYRKLRANPKADTKKLARMEQEELDKAEKRAKVEGGIGNYYNKGHVVSIATNLVKRFREQVNAAEQELGDMRSDLINVLDQYIARLQADDLASANLPNAIKQSLYAKYIQDPNFYLVEFQLKSTNLESGKASKPILDELRQVFDPRHLQQTIQNIITQSPQLGIRLLKEPGSGTPLDMIIENILSPFPGRKVKPRRQSPSVLIGNHSYKLPKSNNKAKIQKLKQIRNKLAKVKPIPDSKQFIVDKTINPPVSETIPDSILNLQNLLNAGLVARVKQNMGTGGRRDVLNLRSGRFAESVQVERLSESRGGAITAFYSYMRNPYATFSSGGRQQYPRSRDPKLLISKSIRELAQTITQQRLRAVLV
jgi:hypothetical protein